VSTAEVYAERGFGGRQGAGERCALIVVDFIVAFTDPGSPLHCDCDSAIAVTATLLDAARAAGAPVVFTTIAYDEASARTAAQFIAKAPALGDLVPGSPATAVDARLAPRPGEAVLVKRFASAFFATELSSLLVAERVDTVVVAGASTSGCVRATAVDAVSHGLRTLVPAAAVADRAPGPHAAALLDLDAKYADVVDVPDAVRALRGRPSD
jgi:maleamate amidohydrolase